jgi:8-oxo-dGTP pyrophosphatase MutT (NUDIX family)
MKTSGSFAVITNEKNQILLVKRRDFPLWDLPGGRVEIGENSEQAAIREAFEESGFQIEITKFSGKYFNPELDDTQFIFRGKIVGGQAIEVGPETSKVKFFSQHHLPFLMIPHRKMQIKKALTNLSEPIFQEIHDSFIIRKIKGY